MAVLAVQADKPIGRRRGGRQLDAGYGAPVAGGYGAPSEEVLDVRSDELPGKQPFNLLYCF